MSYPIYYVYAGDVLPVMFATYGKTNGESITMTGLAVTDIEIYKDGSTTQRASDAGYTLLDTDGIDFDGTTGIHGFSIDTGDNTDASFYTVGAWFTVVISAITIDSQTVNFIACAFRIMKAEGVAGVPKVDVDALLGTAHAAPATAGLPDVNVKQISTDATAADNAELFFDGTGYAGGTTKLGVDVVSLSGDTTAADNAESFFDGTGYKDIDNSYVVRSATGQAGASTTITLDASAHASDDFYKNTYVLIISGTGASQARFITAYVGSTKVATVDRAWTTNPSSDSVFVIYPFGSLPGASAPTAAEVADQVWDEARSGHVSAGSFGEYALTDVVKVSGTAAVADNLETVFTTVSNPAHLGQINTGTAQSVTSTTIVLAASFSAPDSALIGATVHVYSATNGKFQSRVITAWNNTTKTATVDTWNETPTGTILYNVFATAPASSASPIPVNLTQILGTNVATPDTSGYLKVTIKDGTGQGELNITSGVVDANAVQLSGDSTAADNSEAFFDGTGYAGTGNVIPSVTTVTGNVNGSVASVTGAVGSVTGAVGSVTGAVGSVTAIAANAVSASALATDAVTEVADAVLRAALTESYAADGAAPTLSQAIFAIQQFLQEKGISGTTMTVKKLDGSTTAMTFTLSDATTPASITRAS